MYDPVAILRQWVISRRQKTSKYKAGFVFVLAGSETYPGAAVLATHAAARMGVGGVIVGTPSIVKPLILSCVPEAIVLALPSTSDGFLLEEGFPLISDALEKCTAILIGPGLGRHPRTVALVHHILMHTKLPMVIDADGLFALAEFGHENLTQCPRLLTPHRGELSLFTGSAFNEETLSAFASQWKSVVLSKGFPSRVVFPAGKTYVNETGNTAATTAGCGDVLAGICVSFVAQGLLVQEAAVAGLYLAGLAADVAVSQLNLPGLMASDIIEFLPIAIGSCRDAQCPAS